MLNKPPSEAVLARAAELRAEGNTWEAVAKEMKRPARTIRRWPRKYPERWWAALHIAERRLMAETGSESLLILRQLLRSKDDKLRWHVANALLRHRSTRDKFDIWAAIQKTSPNTMTDGQRLAFLFESLTDEHLERLYLDELA